MNSKQIKEFSNKILKLTTRYYNKQLDWNSIWSYYSIVYEEYPNDVQKYNIKMYLIHKKLVKDSPTYCILTDGGKVLSLFLIL